MSNAHKVLHSADCLSVIKGHSSCRMGQVCVCPCPSPCVCLCVCVCHVNKQTHKQTQQVPAGSKFQFQFQAQPKFKQFFFVRCNTRGVCVISYIYYIFFFFHLNSPRFSRWFAAGRTLPQACQHSHIQKANQCQWGHVR